MGCLRLFLAISVLIAHSGPLFGSHLAGGPPAVQAFFSVSGFYMALVLNEKYARGPAGTGAFYLNRLLRLAPVYWIVLAATVAFVLHGPTDGPYFARLQQLTPEWQAVTWVINTVAVGADVFQQFVIDPATGSMHYVAGADLTSSTSATGLLLVPQGWTLAIEAWFYLLAPWLVRLRPRWLLLLTVASLACRLVLAKGFGLAAGAFYYGFFPNELATFLFGVWAYRGYRQMGRDNPLARRFGWVTLAAVLAFTFIWFRLPVPFKSLGFALFVAACLPTLFIASKSARWDRWIGELAYPLYLGHGLLHEVLGPIGRDPRVLLPIGLAVSAVLLVIVDRPLDRLRQRLAMRVAKRGSDLASPAPLPTA